MMSLQWSPWTPLLNSWRGATIPAQPGLYRIRRIDFDGLDYLGQTGVTLRARLAMLHGLWSEEMPYRDPHTAAPGLWALRQIHQAEFDVSTCVIESSKQQRLGLECLAISIYRQGTGASPTLEFGRMPQGYFMSSGNNARLVARGLRFRGGICEDKRNCHLPGIAPQGPLDGDVNAPLWCGHHWSVWQPLQQQSLASLLPTAQGLYRLRRSGQKELLYVGQGNLRARLSQHAQNLYDDATEFSYVTNSEWQSHQRLELECDLIAAHVLQWARPPVAQFLSNLKIQ